MSTVYHMMSDDAFAHLVAQDIKNNVNDNQRQFLRESQNLNRWARCLNALLSNLDEQIEEIEGDMESDTEQYSALGEDGSKLLAEAMHHYLGQKRKIEKFKGYVLRKINEVAELISMLEDGVSSEDDILVMCRQAIIRHRKELNENDIEPTPYDEALWDVLNGQWNFDNIEYDGANLIEI